MAPDRITGYIEKFARTTPEAPVILHPGRPALTYARLFEYVQKTQSFFSAMAIKPGCRIAAALPDGPEIVPLFFAVSDMATFIPLNPDSPLERSLDYLRLLRVSALVVEAGTAAALQEAALKIGIPVIYMEPDSEAAAGIFQLQHRDASSALPPIDPAADPEIAVIFHTSGTTSRPKFVPRTQVNLCVSAEDRARAYALTAADRSLITFPLYRSNTFNMILSSVAVGGSFLCIGRFDPGEFFQLLNEAAPTWFSAGPAVLQTIVDYAGNYHPQATNSQLRFIRSTGATLSPRLANNLKHLFAIPVIVTYGSTETGNVTCDYLAPKGKKAGSAGISSGPKIAICSGNGEWLPAGMNGEILLRGPGVSQNYEADPELTAAAFRDGWFHTGDLGYLDDDDYLFITGRIKELINRGGEKIAPSDVEQAILQHPEVLEAVVFAAPDPRLCEAVAAAVVIVSGASLSLAELRRFLTGKVPYFKMPSRLWVVDAIPADPGGKIRRNSVYHLLEKWPETSVKISPVLRSSAPPATKLQRQLARIWQKILHCREITAESNFFELGGDSLSFSLLYTEIEARWRCQLLPAALQKTSSLAGMARLIEAGMASEALPHLLLPLRGDGSRPPLFCIHAVDGEVFSYHKLAAHLLADQPVYGLRFDPRAFCRTGPLSLEKLASEYLRQIKRIQPAGPYHLLGHSLGGKIGFEMARQLLAGGEAIAMLAMLDTRITRISTRHKNPEFRRQRLQSMTPQEKRAWRLQKRRREWRRLGENLRYFLCRITPPRIRALLGGVVGSEALLRNLSRDYQPVFARLEIDFFQPADANAASPASADIWGNYAATVKRVTVGGGHGTLLAEPQVHDLARAIRAVMDEASQCPEKTTEKNQKYFKRRPAIEEQPNRNLPEY